MPVFIFGGAEKWFRQVFDKNFTDIVQEVSPSEIAQIYMTSLTGKPRERQRYLQEQSMVDYSKSDVCRLRTAESGWACGFSNFLAPVDNNGVLDLAKAGQTIPLKWRLTDANGSRITNLIGVSVVAVGLSCSSGMITDQIEEYASGGSGLQNLGNGYYQWNWKTPTTYAKSCKTLKLDLAEGTGFENTALFQFKK